MATTAKGGRRPSAPHHPSLKPTIVRVTLPQQVAKSPPSEGRQLRLLQSRSSLSTAHQPCTNMCGARSVMILPQVHLRKPCYDFYFL